jgi:hypothetical protein
MMWFKRVAAILALAVLVTAVACQGSRVTRERWQAMTADERELTVRALIGGEAAADAKGGTGARYSRPVGEYVAELDRMYGAGDQRDVETIWPELRDR